MESVIGVRFEPAGKIYYFKPDDSPLTVGDHVIVRTVRGVEYGEVVQPPHEVPSSDIRKPLKGMMRKADAYDDRTHERCLEQAEIALEECKKIVVEEQLDMKMVKAVYTFDGRKLLFYFSAEGRVDFRNLVRRLAARFRTRIELRQIGARDATKKIGGLGTCGRVLCCRSFLPEFAPVSIKMVRAQNVSLNPAKISGHCGRLRCCLSYEHETYKELNKGVPKVGATVRLKESGEVGRVQSVDVLRRQLRVLIDEGDEKNIIQCDVDEIKGCHGKNR
ncbi:MAG: stage 0 sporulation family protein [Eubacteriales bacterium]|nr:stage 0 sporulation family protein [Eubacteriales bacterium]